MWSIPGSEAMCDVAPESMTHSPTVEGAADGVMALFREAMSAEQSHVGVSV